MWEKYDPEAEAAAGGEDADSGAGAGEKRDITVTEACSRPFADPHLPACSRGSCGQGAACSKALSRGQGREEHFPIGGDVGVVPGFDEGSKAHAGESPKLSPAFLKLTTACCVQRRTCEWWQKDNFRMSVSRELQSW